MRNLTTQEQFINASIATTPYRNIIRSITIKLESICIYGVLKIKYLTLNLSLFLFPCIISAEESEVSALPSNLVDVNMSVLKVTLALGFVVLVIFASAWLFRRFASLPAVKNDALTIVGGLSLGNRERIVLLQIGEQQILLGVTPGKLETLHVLEKPLDTSKPMTASKDQFSHKLQKAIKQWGKK